MTLKGLLADLDQSAYAPFRDPRDFILSWTDAIWIDRGLGRLNEHDAADVNVHTAYGETYDWNHVVSNSLQKFAAFPNAGGGLGEDVIWESRGRNAFISSHRTIKSRTHTGCWIYGAPTGILREFSLIDEIAILAQIYADRHAPHASERHLSE